MKKIRYIAEYYLLLFFFFLFSNLPYNISSNLGGLILRILGPFTKANRIASANLINILKIVDIEKRKSLLKDIWDNTGRFIAEFSQAFDMPDGEFDDYIEVIDDKYLKHLKEKGGLLFSAHFGNWEFIPRVLYRHRIKMYIIYRRANNKMVDELINNYRQRFDVVLVPKGKEGAKLILKAVKEKAAILMLIDQKLDEGDYIDFLGKEAKTPNSIASLALKYDLPILPVKSSRLENKVNLSIQFYDKVKIPKAKDLKSQEKMIMKRLNQIIGEWIIEDPKQWFWLHNRWGK